MLDKGHEESCPVSKLGQEKYGTQGAGRKEDMMSSEAEAEPGVTTELQFKQLEPSVGQKL